jgi:VIT1/CCC1 family predicted Fe2+/Mn2+ transporter
MAQEPFTWTQTDLKGLEKDYLSELSAQWTYAMLAGMDKDAERAMYMRMLSDYERDHAETWKRIMEKLGHPLPRARRTASDRILIALARVFGPGAVLAVLHKGEVEGIAKYMRQQERWKDPMAQDAFAKVLPDEVLHEVDLFSDLGRQSASGGALRSMILGANDGFGSILALVAGVAGAINSSPTIFIAGLAGLVSGAASMAASNYVSIKAEQEAQSSMIRLESQAIEVSPNVKRAQLKNAYINKGLNEQEAGNVANRLAGNREEFLKAVVAEEHGVANLQLQKPLRLAMYTGLAFILAGIAPIIPFLFLPPLQGITASVAFTCTALFFAGVIRSLSTLKPFVRSGIEMVLIGLGASAVTYLVGLAVGLAV